MKKLFTLICLCVLAASTSWAQQIYTEFVEETGTLTYYYDTKMSSRSGITEVYDQDDGIDIYTSYGNDVLKAVIDPSMKDAPLTSTCRMFADLSQMSSIQGLENLNTAKVTDMNGMFYNCTALKSLDLSSFNTAKVTDMSNMFYSCESLTSLDLNSFNTAKVTDMSLMFYGCQRLKSLDLNSFNTAKVTDMSLMFYGCQRLTSLDLSSFNTANVTDMSYMFCSCQSLTSLDLSSFNTANVTDMSNMFQACQWLTSLNLSSFNTAKVTNMRYMFNNCQSLTSLDISSFNTANVTHMARMFYNCTALKSLDLSSFNTANVTDMARMFYDCQNLTTIFCNDNCSTSSVLKSSEDMFKSCYALVGGNGTKYANGKVDKTYARPDGGTSKPGYFTGRERDVYTEFDETTGTLTYYYDANRETRTGITELYTPEDHDALRFTGYYKKVTKAVIDPSIKNAPLTSTYSMFYGGVSQDPFGIYALENMTEIEGLENLNTSAVTDMESMFFGCYALTQLDLSSFNTSAVTNMNGMFSMCQALTQLDLSSFNTSNVKDFNCMFAFCNKLKMIDVSSFDISKATDMRQMFSYCGELTTICCDKDWSSTSANSEYMFSTSRKLVGGKGTAYDSNFLDATYARPDGGTASPGYFTADTMTGISLTEEGRSQMEDGAIYNLAGQRLSKTQRGINIVGGKKIAVK